MNNRLLLFFVLICFSTSAIAQKQLTWEDFADVNFQAQFNEKYGVHFLMPTFGDKIMSYKGKQVSIKGYFLDISGSGEIFLVSQNPMASCFFCGGSGPETIIEVSFKEKPSFKTDQIVVITGLLELNANDVDHCNYILSEATGRLVN
ncbi:hypothetical protein [Flagellimonas meridianipacifica]|uniref:DUF3299 domain-containing protein n=1 Tax=Flagellimonas meridianipacifica TaxID=1080225 RepID=A0A2T0MIQ2_9FLAO|nr:hypothetical protein [Allomuricauda pacifica]PRX57468.1 hypothetical protein CLV81_1473 [Allomuricauda pacifica]